jgi:predicted phage terminase large subunit-like protein
MSLSTFLDNQQPPPLVQFALMVADQTRRRAAWADRCGEIAQLDLLAWGRRFLPAHFRSTPSRMHRWLAVELDQMRTTRGVKLNVLGPRGGAKSTVVTLAYVLRSALEHSDPYIWIVSDTEAQARTHLENIRAELEQNEQLRHGYPYACGRGRRWRASAIELVRGATIEAYGAGQQLRGRRRRQYRPSLIVCDDVENDFLVASGAQRQATRDWFHGTLLKAGNARTNVVNLATALHRDALAMRLHRAPGWLSEIFRAIERWPDNMELWQRWEALYCELGNPSAREAAGQYFDGRREAMLAGAELLWPEEEDLYALMRMRVEEGRTAFEREKQNVPVDPAACEWPEEYFGDDIWFHDWPARLEVRTIALDPSKGADARLGDYCAYVMLGVDASGRMYVEADLARRPTPEIVADGVGLCRRFRPDALGVESNQFQELLADQFVAEFRRQRTRQYPIYRIHNDTNKRVRIRRLAPYLAQCRLKFHLRTSGTRLLVEQLREFPAADFDDGPDALEMAIRLADALLSRDSAANDGFGDRLILDA